VTITLRYLKSLCIPHERRCILAKILMTRRLILSAVLPACIAVHLAAMPISVSESPSDTRTSSPSVDAAASSLVAKDSADSAEPPDSRYHLSRQLGSKDFITFRTEYFNDLKGQRTNFKTLYTEQNISWNYWIGSTVAFRPELKYDHAYDALSYNSGSKRASSCWRRI